MIIEFIDFKEGKLPNPKKIPIIVSMPMPTNPQHIQVFNYMAPIMKLIWKSKPFVWTHE
jgi:hypothetical protein